MGSMRQRYARQSCPFSVVLNDVKGLVAVSHQRNSHHTGSFASRRTSRRVRGPNSASVK